MLSFSWVFGDSSDGTPEEIPQLLADLANADVEHTDVSFSKEDISVGVFPGRQLTIEDVESDTLLPHHFEAPDDETIIAIARLLDQGKVQEIVDSYPWKKGYY